MKTIKIDLDACNGCKLCVKACFIDVLRWDDEQDVPVAAYPEDCAECFACELICKTKAIEVIPDLEHSPLPAVI